MIEVFFVGTEGKNERVFVEQSGSAPGPHHRLNFRMEYATRTLRLLNHLSNLISRKYES